MCVCVVGEKKKERQGIHEWKGKKKEIKKKKEIGSGEWGLRACGKKKREWKRKKKKKFEREKTKLVLFIYTLCLVQSIEL